jgi:hypothetical protein
VFFCATWGTLHRHILCPLGLDVHHAAPTRLGPPGFVIPQTDTPPSSRH